MSWGVARATIRAGEVGRASECVHLFVLIEDGEAQRRALQVFGEPAVEVDAEPELGLEARVGARCGGRLLLTEIEEVEVDVRGRAQAVRPQPEVGRIPDAHRQLAVARSGADRGEGERGHVGELLHESGDGRVDPPSQAH